MRQERRQDGGRGRCGAGRGRGGQGRNRGAGRGQGRKGQAVAPAAPPPSTVDARAQAMLEQVVAPGARGIIGAPPPDEPRIRTATKPEPDRAAGLHAVVDPERCICCWMCVDLCPEEAITMTDVARVDPERCSACGACVQDCPNGAVALVDANSQAVG